MQQHQKTYMSFEIMDLNSIIDRIPHVGDLIFKKIDNQSLVKYKHGNRSSYSLINQRKEIWIRLIISSIGETRFDDQNFEFYTAWRNVLKRTSSEFVQHLGIATEQFCRNNELQIP